MRHDELRHGRPILVVRGSSLLSGSLENKEGRGKTVQAHMLLTVAGTPLGGCSRFVKESKPVGSLAQRSVLQFLPSEVLPCPGFPQ